MGLQGIEKDWTGFKYGMKKLHIVKLKRFEINKKRLKRLESVGEYWIFSIKISKL